MQCRKVIMYASRQLKNVELNNSLQDSELVVVVFYYGDITYMG